MFGGGLPNSLGASMLLMAHLEILGLWATESFTFLTNFNH